MKIRLSKEHTEILKALNDNHITLTEIAKKVGLPITTAWRRLNELVNERVITKDYKLTRKGRLIKAILS